MAGPKVRKSFFIDEDEWNLANANSKVLGTTVSQVLREALEAFNAQAKSKIEKGQK